MIWIVVAIPVAARADVFDDGTWRYTGTGALALDAGLAVGFPAALPTGLARGVEGGVTWGQRFAIGARAAYASATESSAAWLVTHREVGLRVTGAVQHRAGRGLLALRLGLGGTLVHESRLRHEGMRAGLTGDALETTATALLPVANLDAVVGVQLRGPWRVQLSGGPALVLDDGAHAGWSASVGVAWQP